MKRLRNLLVTMAACVLGASMAGASDLREDALLSDGAPDAAQIMSRAFENYFRYSYVARMDITVRPPHGQPLHRVLDMAHWREEDHASRWRIAFLDPPHLRGTQLLAIEQRARDDDHFLFSPEFRRVRRVSGAQQADRIAGTDFSFEDLDIKYVEQFELARERTGESAGRVCHWVRGVPRYDSEYAMLRWCVDRERFVILEARGFGAGGRLIKTLRVDPDSIEQVGDHQLAQHWEMTDERSGSRTHIELIEVHVEPDFSRDVFSTSSLERTHELPFLSAYGSGRSR